MVTIKQITSKFKGTEYIGSKTVSIAEIIQLDTSNKRKDVLYWCSDKNIDKLNSCSAGTIICTDKVKSIGLKKTCNYLITKNPRQLFSAILNEYFVEKADKPTISSKANIHKSVKIGKNVFIGDFTVIESGCVIGNNCYIGHNNVLHKKIKIGNNVKIGSNNTIGGVGFGYEKNEMGDYEVLPHIGNVVIENKVEIGNNTCIDRAVLGSTLIMQNVKIDNLVHVAHGVVIGENSLIIANAMIGGSAVIGKNVWVSPSVSIINKGEIEDGALVGMGAVVVKPVKSKTIVVGNPAKYLKDI